MNTYAKAVAFDRGVSMLDEMHEIDIDHINEADILVDLRDEYTYSTGTLPGAINIPLNSLSKLYSLPKDKKICVFCQAGEISVEIVELLLDAGYDACHIIGGYRSYLRKHLEPTG